MTRISNFQPPAELADTLGQLFYTRKATANQSASATFTDKGRVKEVAPPKPKDPLYLKPVIDWMIANGPAAWRGANAASIRQALLLDLNGRVFHGDYWTGAARLSDNIEISYPAIVRPWENPPDPNDPLDIANSKCTYKSRSLTWAYTQASPWGWPPLPGWDASTDPERWFIDNWHAQRSSTFYVPPGAGWGEEPPWLMHIHGDISAESEESGLRLWFAPVVKATIAKTQINANAVTTATGSYWPLLYNLAVTLPTKGDGWQHTAHFDWVFRGPSIPWWGLDATYRWLNIKLSTRATCGTYRAANAWARCSANLTMAVYFPRFLG